MAPSDDRRGPARPRTTTSAARDGHPFGSGDVLLHRLLALADGAGDVLFLASGAGSLRAIGPGRQPGELRLGRGWWRDVHADDRPGLARSWADARSASALFMAEFRLREPERQWRWVRALAVPRMNANGLEWVGRLTDVHAERLYRQRLERRASSDDLTGLLNRRQLRAELATLIADPQARPHAMLYVDLDGFKRVNDTIGHAMGDMVLREVALAMRRVLHGTVLARLGGDEFGVLLPCASYPDEAVRVGLSLIAAVSLKSIGGAAGLDVGACVGITRVCGTDSVDTVLARADAAMYRAKRGGRGGVAVYET